MPREVYIAVGGVVTGIAISGVALYFLSPKIAEKAATLLVGALSTEVGIPASVIAPFAPFIGRATNKAVRDALPL